MSRFENWLRQRGRDGQPDLTPEQQALGRKVLGELMESVQRGGLFQGKLRREFPDGTVVVAQFDGTTPMVTIEAPTTAEQTLECKPLGGKIGAAKPFSHPEMFFPHWPDATTGYGLLAPFGDAVYVFTAPDKLYKYLPATDVLQALPVVTAGAPDFSTVGAPYVYQAANGKLRFAVCTFNLTTAYEYEFGTGWLAPIAIPAPIAKTYSFNSWAQPGIDNSQAPLWGQSTRLFAAWGWRDDSNVETWGVSGYDFVRHTPIPLVPFAYDQTGRYNGGFGVGIFGSITDTVTLMSATESLDLLYSGNDSYNIPNDNAFYAVNTRTHDLATGRIAMRFNPHYCAQLCQRAYVFGALAAPRYVAAAPPAPAYFDYQLLPDYSQVVEIDLLAHSIRKIGSLPFSTTDAKLLYNQSNGLFLVPRARELLVFYPELQPIVPTPTDPTAYQYNLVGMNLLRVT